MPDFGDTAGEFVRNLIRSLQEEVERAPSPLAMMESLREFEPTPEQVTEIAGKCADAVTSFGAVLAGMVRGARQARNDPMPEHIDIPDDLSDL